MASTAYARMRWNPGQPISVLLQMQSLPNTIYFFLQTPSLQNFVIYLHCNSFRIDAKYSYASNINMALKCYEIYMLPNYFADILHRPFNLVIPDAIRNTLLILLFRIFNMDEPLNFLPPQYSKSASNWYFENPKSCKAPSKYCYFVPRDATEI